MNEIDIRKYAGLMQELGLTGLEITQNDQMVRLERSIPAATAVTPIQAPVAAPTPQQPQDSGLISIKSPIVGVFYAAPTENAEPFVSLGDRVEKGKTVCIIEAMKLMNEIAAETDGIIEEICVTNGQVVEFGTELFKIRR